MKRISKSEMHPADIDLEEQGFYDEIFRRTPREPQPLEGKDLIEAMGILADALKSLPTPIVNVQAPNVQVTVTPEVVARLPKTVEKTRIIRGDEKHPNLITGAVREVEEK